MAADIIEERLKAMHVLSLHSMIELTCSYFINKGVVWRPGHLFVSAAQLV